jgi:DNA-binding CsgD family transcriptional regulator
MESQTVHHHQQVAELTLALLAGPFETPLFDSFLDGLRRAMGADYATLTFQPPGWRMDEGLLLIAGDAQPADMQRIYRQYCHPIDLVERDWAIEGQSFSLEDQRSFDRGAHREFYRELMGTIGITASRQIRVEAIGVDAWLAVARGGADFSDDDTRLLTAIGPILRGVLRNFVAHEKDHIAASLASDAVGRLRFGWIALDRTGKILEADAFGERTLAGSGIIGRNAAGRLDIAARDVERDILDTIARMADQPDSRPRPVRLRGDPWFDLLLVPARGKLQSMISAPAVIAYVHGDNWQSTERCAQLADYFALTPSEARLALAICRGRTITEASVELGLTVETARSYSKTLYAKTGARGLADLVRIIMGSILALAPEL